MNLGSKKGERLLFGLIVIALFASLAFANPDIENLEVTACTFGGCIFGNYNENTTSVGSSLTKGDSDVVDIASPATLAGGDTINKVDFSFRWTNVVNLDGFWDFRFRSQDGNTEYCFKDNAITQTDDNSDQYAVLDILTGCVDTKAKLDDLEVLIFNDDGQSGRTGDVLYVNITIDFTPDTTKPRINASLNNSAPKINEIVNFTANVTDNVALDTCQFFMNGTSDGGFVILNKSVTGTDDQCSQNFTIDLIRGNVINFTVIINDTNNNLNQSEQIITVANTPAPNATILFPTNDLKTNLQPLDLNISFAPDPDGDILNISYYIDGKLNQTSLYNTTFNASDGIYILNISLIDNVTGADPSRNVTVNFTIDTVKPIINLSSPVNEFNSSSQNVTFSFNVTDTRSNRLNCSIYIDANLNQTNSSSGTLVIEIYWDKNPVTVTLTFRINQSNVLFIGKKKLSSLPLTSS